VALAVGKRIINYWNKYKRRDKREMFLLIKDIVKINGK
jgi:hypothetical protein